MTSFLRFFFGQRQRDKAATARAHQNNYPPGTLGHERWKWIADGRELIAEWLDGREGWARVYRLACMYPIPWRTAERYEREHGERAGEMIEARLRGGREP